MPSLTKKQRQHIEDLGRAIDARDRSPERRYAGAVDTDRLTAAERRFMDHAREQGKMAARNGWPDFLVEDRRGGIIGVEVKSGSDMPSSAQRTMFALLERVHLYVYIWHPDDPNQLTPWRDFKPRLKSTALHERIRDAVERRNVKAAQSAYGFDEYIED